MRLALSMARAYVLLPPVSVIKRSGFIIKGRAFARAEGVMPASWDCTWLVVGWLGVRQRHMIP